ncbi:TPA: hypothetical protein U2L31_005524 [Burkholderia contaminans]|nr:hypothetical protein [Burkholderia contaminans]
MSIDVEKQAELASWISDVKVLMNNLNDYLARTPDGIDVKVSASEVVLPVGGIVNYAEVGSTWQINISATRTEKLI